MKRQREDEIKRAETESCRDVKVQRHKGADTEKVRERGAEKERFRDRKIHRDGEIERSRD